MLIGMQQSRDSGQRLLTVCHYSHIGLHVLVYLATVNIQMNNLGLLGIRLRITRHTVGETHTDSYQHVALLLFQVDGIVAVHTQHTHVQGMVGWQCRQTQHGASGRNIGFLQECLQLLLCITQLYALPYQRQGALGIVDQFGSLTYSLVIQLGLGYVRTHEINLLGFPFYLLYLCITREVEHYRTRATATCNIERTTDSPSHILGMTNLVSPLTDRLSHTHEVNLLEGIGTQSRNSHLSGYHHDGR